MAVNLCFTVTSVAWAAPGVVVATAITKEMPTVSVIDKITIPDSIGTVKERYHSANPNAPLIVYIEDAHSQYQAQVNIQNILSHLKKEYGLNTLLVEGGLGKQDPRLLKFFDDPQWNRDAAESMARDGLIGGVELFMLEEMLADDDDPVQAFGVEDPSLYRRNLRAFRSVLERSATAETVLARTKAQILTRGSRVFNKKLSDFFKKWVFYEDVSGELMRHLDVIRVYAARELEIDFTDARLQQQWPQLVRLFLARKAEEALNAEGVREEIAEISAWIRIHGLDSFASGMKQFEPAAVSPVRTQNEETPRDFLHRFYDETSGQGFSFQDYPHFSKMAGAVILRSELNAGELMEELTRVRNEILEALAVKPEETELVRLYRDFLLLQQLFRLELIPANYRELLDRLDGLKPKAMESRLEGQVPVSSLEDLFDEALAFYRDAKKRERAMFDHALSAMKTSGSGAAVLVAGGFHSEGLTDIFKAQDVSYVGITPHLPQREESDHYHDAMTLTRDRHTLKSYIRFFSRVQPLGSVTQPLIGEREAHHGALGINSAVSRRLVQDPANLAARVNQVNRNDAYRRHAQLKYQAYEHEGQPLWIIWLNQQAVRSGEFYVGFTASGPRLFSEAFFREASPVRSELRAADEDEGDVGPWDLESWADVEEQARDLLLNGRIDQVVMLQQSEYRPGKFSDQITHIANEARSFHSSPSRYLKQHLQNLHDTYLSAPSAAADSARARRKKVQVSNAEKFRFKLSVEQHAVKKKDKKLPTLVVIYIRRRQSPGSQRSELRTEDDSLELAALHGEQGKVLMAEGRYDDALADFQQAVKYSDAVLSAKSGPTEKSLATQNKNLAVRLMADIRKLQGVEDHTLPEAAVEQAILLAVVMGYDLLKQGVDAKAVSQALKALAVESDRIKDVLDLATRIAKIPTVGFIEDDRVLKAIEPFADQFEIISDAKEGRVDFEVRAPLSEKMERLAAAVEIPGAVIDLDVITIPVNPPNAYDPAIMDGGHTVLLHYHAIRAYKENYRERSEAEFDELDPRRLRARDERRNAAEPSKEELTIALNWGRGEEDREWQEAEVEDLLARINTEVLQSDTQPFELLDNLPVEGIMTLAEQDYRNVKKLAAKIAAEDLITYGVQEELSFETDDSMSASVSMVAESDGKTVDEVLDYLRESRARANDVWRLFYVVIWNRLSVPVRDTFTDVMLDQGLASKTAEHYAPETQRQILLAYDLIKRSEPLWSAYDHLFWGRDLPERALEAIIKNPDPFIEFLYQLRYFFEQEPYFRSRPFKIAVAQGVMDIDIPHNVRERGLDDRVKPFLTGLQGLGNRANTDSVIRRLGDAIIAYARAHYGNDGIMAPIAESADEQTKTGIVRDFLAAARERLQQLQEQYHKTHRSVSEEARKLHLKDRIDDYLDRPLIGRIRGQIDSLHVVDLPDADADFHAAIETRIATHLDKTEPAFHVISELARSEKITLEQAGLLTIIAADPNYAREGDAATLATRISIGVHIDETTAREALQGWRSPVTRSLVRFLRDLDWQADILVWATKNGLEPSDFPKEEMTRLIDAAGETKVNVQGYEQSIMTNEQRLSLRLLLHDARDFYWEMFRKAENPNKFVRDYHAVADRIEQRYQDLQSKVVTYLSQRSLLVYEPYLGELAPSDGLQNLATWLGEGVGARDLQAFLFSRGYRFERDGSLKQVLTQRRETRAKADKNVRRQVIRQEIQKIALRYLENNDAENWYEFSLGLMAQIRDQIEGEEVALIYSLSLDEVALGQFREILIDPLSFALVKAHQALIADGQDVSLPALLRGLSDYIGAKELKDLGESIITPPVMSRRVAALNNEYLENPIRQTKALPIATEEEALRLLSAADAHARLLLSAYFQALQTNEQLPPSKPEIMVGLAAMGAHDDAVGIIDSRFEELVVRINSTLMGHASPQLQRAPIRIVPRKLKPNVVAIFHAWQQLPGEGQDRTPSLQEIAAKLKWEGWKFKSADDEGAADKIRVLADFLVANDYADDWEMIGKLHPAFDDVLEPLLNGAAAYRQLQSEAEVPVDAHVAAPKARIPKSSISAPKPRETTTVSQKESRRELTTPEVDEAIDEKLLPFLRIEADQPEWIFDEDYGSTPQQYLETIASVSGHGILPLAFARVRERFGVELMARDLIIVWGHTYVAYGRGVASVAEIIEKLSDYINFNGDPEVEILDALDRVNDLLDFPYYLTDKTAYVGNVAGIAEQQLLKAFDQQLINSYDSYDDLVAALHSASYTGKKLSIRDENERLREIRLRMKWNLALDETGWKIARAYRFSRGTATNGVSEHDLVKELKRLSIEITAQALEDKIQEINHSIRRLHPNLQMILSRSVRKPPIPQDIIAIYGPDYYKALAVEDKARDTPVALHVRMRRTLPREGSERPIAREAIEGLRGGAIGLSIVYRDSAGVMQTGVFTVNRTEYDRLYEAHGVIENRANRSELRQDENENDDVLITPDWGKVSRFAKESLGTGKIDSIVLARRKDFSSGEYEVVYLGDPPAEFYEQKGFAAVKQFLLDNLTMFRMQYFAERSQAPQFRAYVEKADNLGVEAPKSSKNVLVVTVDFDESTERSELREDTEGDALRWLAEGTDFRGRDNFTSSEHDDIIGKLERAKDVFSAMHTSGAAREKRQQANLNIVSIVGVMEAIEKKRRALSLQWALEEDRKALLLVLAVGIEMLTSEDNTILMKGLEELFRGDDKKIVVLSEKERNNVIKTALAIGSAAQPQGPREARVQDILSRFDENLVVKDFGNVSQYEISGQLQEDVDELRRKIGPVLTLKTEWDAVVLHRLVSHAVLTGQDPRGVLAAALKVMGVGADRAARVIENAIIIHEIEGGGTFLGRKHAELTGKLRRLGLGVEAGDNQKLRFQNIPQNLRRRIDEIAAAMGIDQDTSTALAVDSDKGESAPASPSSDVLDNRTREKLLWLAAQLAAWSSPRRVAGSDEGTAEYYFDTIMMVREWCYP
ncbi:MAG: hypothetical protein Q8R76_03265 [Candidatus Omnitrophota bacterium]|nr:hypothetical protein [Candidatus Omnitrophota bacterium]